MNPRNFYELVRITVAEWSRHKAPTLAAALAYYTIFSISPLLIIVIAIAGLVFGQQAAQQQIVGQVQGLVGKEGAGVIQTMLANAYHPGTNILLTAVGLITLLLGAIGVFGQLQDSLNTIWEVRPKPSRGILGLIRTRLLSFGLLLGTGFLLLVSLVLSAGLQGIGQYLGERLPISTTLLEALNFILSFVVITVLFAMIYEYLPDAEIHWRDVWIGAACTALLFTIGKFLIGLYLGRSSVGSTYGAAGALVIVLLWIYYSAQILFFGAEFTRVYANLYGSRVVSDAGAAPVARVALNAGEPTPQPQEQRGERPGQPHRPAGAAGGSEPPTSAPPRRDLVLERNMAALFGFLAGAITGARILGHAGQVDGHRRGRGDG